jgi:flagellar hook-associated protein 1 FlgK
MGTLRALLDLSEGSLLANQSALDITANNVANANTVGYTAKVATWQENDVVSLSPKTNSGEGASVTAISQRDPVLNHRVQQQTQLVSASSAESTALSQLETVFGISSGSNSSVSTAIGKGIDSLFNSLSSLQASPSDPSIRRGVLNAASTLAGDFNNASTQIAQQTSSLNLQVTGNVSQINSLTSSIATLNLQIATANGSDAGTLEDQRQQFLTQLSGFIGFDQTRTENNGLTLTTANGTPLVSEGKAYSLGVSAAGVNTNVVDSVGRDITSSITGGSLGGVLQARDHDLPAVLSSLDSLAYAIGTAVNTQNAAGLDANGNPGGVVFTLPTSSSGAAATIASAITDPNAIAAASVGQGPTGGGNAAALSALSNAALVSGQSASAFYASFLTGLGSTVARVADENTTQNASLTQLSTQQSALSSVSLDQEAANLTQYERSYNAAAKIFAIVNQLMAVAINLGQQTTVA